MTEPIDAVVRQHLDRTFPAAQIEIRLRGETAYSRSFGVLDPDTRQHAVNDRTRFDLASVSKLFTVTALMTFVEKNRVGLDQPVREIVSEFSGTRLIRPYPNPLQTGAQIAVVPETQGTVDADLVTFRHLLAHNSGLPAWLPLYKLESRAERQAAVLHSAFAYPTGSHVVYSDIGLILLGLALERVASMPLDQILRATVLQPLALSSVSFGPVPCDSVAPTEFYEWRGQRMCGEVHDENAHSLGGVAGHAGLFGAARDVAALGEMYRRGGGSLLTPETVREMTRLQAQDGALRRGLGLALWSPDPAASSNPFSEKAFGHTGFTGTSLWVDPTRDLVVACLTNRVYYGRANADALATFRVALHRAIIEVVDHGSRFGN